MPTTRTIYFKADNKPYELAAIDARNALRDHPKEWSDQPWPKESQNKG